MPGAGGLASTAAAAAGLLLLMAVVRGAPRHATGTSTSRCPCASPPRPGPSAPPAAPRLVLTGGLSRADGPWLEPQLDALVATGARTLEVDLSGVTAMDGAVVRLLLRTSWHLGDPARTLRLLEPQPTVRRALRYSGAGGLIAR